VRNPYCQPFDLRSGEIVELHIDVAGLVSLMTDENLLKYRAGRDDYTAEESLPFASPIELVARKAGRWYLVSEQPLEGLYRVRLGLESRTGLLQMFRRR
jgi:Domain of unknown function (DUF1883)